MSILTNVNGKEIEEYKECVLHYFEENNCYDSDWYAFVWCNEENKIKKVNYDTTRFGGYGSAKLDATEETIRKVLRNIKQEAIYSFTNYAIRFKNEIRKNDVCEVIRGRKIKKGTILTVFWKGERQNYTGYGTEMIVGAYDQEGNKVWIKEEYLKKINKDKSPSAKERNKYIRSYIKRTFKTIAPFYEKRIIL